MEIGDTAEHGHEVYPSDIPSLGYPSGIPGLAVGRHDRIHARMTRESAERSGPRAPRACRARAALESSQQSAPGRGADRPPPGPRR